MILTAITLLPFLAGLVLLGLSAPSQRGLARRISLAASCATLALAVVLWGRFDPTSGGIQLVEGPYNWIPSLGVQYVLGVDGLGLLMVLLTALIVPMALLASWKVEQQTSLYLALVLFLQTGLFGTFTALNFFHWFLYWELSLVPAFFLVRLWGGPQRTAAATQFFVYTMVGSIAMLLAFLALYLATGTFDFVRLAELGRAGQIGPALAAKLSWPHLGGTELSLLVFSGVLLGLAVKVPLVPFHTWLPVAYTEAPSATTMLLTGLMSKMGVYGFVRILLPIFPEQTRQVLTPLLWLAVLTIVLSALAAFAQRDLKRILAYSSINHLGYCMLGLFAAMRLTGQEGAVAEARVAALNGVFLQMFNHGLTAACLFGFVGFLERRSGGLRGLNDFGGLRRIAPVFCGLMGIALFSSLGLPGLNGFVGEFLIFRGVFPLATWAAALATLGLLVTAVFVLTTLQRVFHGPLNERWAAMPDLSWAERMIMAPAIALMFLLGIYPQVVIGIFNRTAVQLLEQFKV
ncbi:MAG: NADH-quinone oxidoreductase subunit M [Verrucomicrobiota bacterium]